MGIRLALRYDMREPAFGGPATELYPAAVEQCAWADEAGFETVYLAEHHGADDGYCPSPIVLAVGDARRHVADGGALLGPAGPAAQSAAPGRGPRRARPVSGGRVEMTLGLGYRPHEYDMFGVEKSKRVPASRRRSGCSSRRGAASRSSTTAGGADPAEARAEAGPPIYIGGSAEASALRAARYGDDFMPAAPRCTSCTPRSAGASASRSPAARARRARCSSSSPTTPSGAGRRRPACHVHGRLQRGVGEGAGRRRHAVPAGDGRRRAEGAPAVRRRHPRRVRRAAALGPGAEINSSR